MRLTSRWLFDASSGELLTDRVVEIDEGRIVSVGISGRTPATDLVDLGEATLMPGLIDIHQHLAFDASTDVIAHLQSDDDPTLLLRMRLAARRAMAVGITTIRDLGDRSYLGVALRDWFAEGEDPGPRILASGPPLTVTKGHCWFLGGEADGEEGLRQSVRDHAGRGVDVIKIMGTGGNMTPTVGPHESQYTLAELKAAVEEAHAHGLPVAVHAHGGQGIADAVAAGADSIEHCTFFTEDGVDADPAIVEALIASGKTVSMTTAGIPGTARPHSPIAQRLEAIYANLAALYRAGARVVCSSDAGITPNKPHYALPFGVTNFLPRIGMSSAEAIVNVTRTAADACGIGETTGTLEVGKDADVLAVAGNPLEDIQAIHQVIAVFARGRPLRMPVRPA